jgi:hypothetical protein
MALLILLVNLCFILVIHYYINEMASSIYDGTCKNCGLDNLSVWIEVRRNVDGIPMPEIWCIDYIRGNNNDRNQTNK